MLLVNKTIFFVLLLEFGLSGYFHILFEVQLRKIPLETELEVQRKKRHSHFCSVLFI